MGNSIIIGVSGRKQSGKNTVGMAIYNWYNFDYRMRENNKGITSSNTLASIHSFADSLKGFLIDNFGVEIRQCHGSDEDKNSFTKYKWDNLPFEIRMKYSNTNAPCSSKIIHEDDGEDTECVEYTACPRTGFMTCRELMQVFGTDVMRKMFCDSVWINATFRMLNNIDQSEVKLEQICHILSDVRFIAEIESVLAEPNGYVIRLLRSVASDNHSSETELDNYDFTKYSDRVLVIDNRNLGIEETNKIAVDWISSKIAK